MPLQYIQLTLTYLWYICLLLVHIFNVFKVQIKIQLLSKYGISGESLCLNCKFSRKSEKDIICASHSYAFSEDIYFIVHNNQYNICMYLQYKNDSKNIVKIDHGEKTYM